MHTTDLLDRLLLAGFAFGAGLGLGLLLAPEAGEATRTRLATQARDAAEAARLQARDLADPVAERARETAHSFSERHIPLADDFDVVDPSVLDDLRTGRS
ncbi:MAG: YtxH domain-containing protein [Bacteroidota bacterium]